MLPCNSESSVEYFQGSETNATICPENIVTANSTDLIFMANSSHSVAEDIRERERRFQMNLGSNSDYPGVARVFIFRPSVPPRGKIRLWLSS